MLNIAQCAQFLQMVALPPRMLQMVALPPRMLQMVALPPRILQMVALPPRILQMFASERMARRHRRRHNNTKIIHRFPMKILHEHTSHYQYFRNMGQNHP